MLNYQLLLKLYASYILSTIKKVGSTLVANKNNKYMN
jgi:hypothetical protein